MNDIITTLNDFMWGWPMIILLLGTHIYLTFRLKVPQRKLWTAIKLSVGKDKNSSGDVSQFGALATSLAATIGTGNIIGVATAISLGGPGAVLWCWLTGVFGIATKYAEGLLAIKYRTKNAEGKMIGGPMYALERGLGMKWLAVVFCIFTAIAAFGIGNTVQANAISENLSLVCKDFADPMTIKMITGFIVAAIVGFVIIGGVRSIANWCTRLVPLMALLYVLGCLYILIVNHQYIIQALQLIISEAFSLKAFGGGTAGTVIMMAARYGIARGLFSNESGMPYVGTPILTFGIITFAFSTILGWSYYGERAVEYLGGRRAVFCYRVLWILLVLVGSVLSLDLVWNISDLMNAMMAIPNLIALLLLSGVIARDTNYYLWEKHLDEES